MRSALFYAILITLILLSGLFMKDLTRREIMLLISLMIAVTTLFVIAVVNGIKKGK